VDRDRLFESDDFEFMFSLALGATYHRGADVGECLSTAARIGDGDFEGWHLEWKATGDRLAAAARASEAGGHTVSAGWQWLRASTYYDTATPFLDATDDPDRFKPTWELHRDAWEGFARNSSPPIERVSIPYEDTELEGYLFRSRDGSEPRPLVLLNNGSDGAVSTMWLLGAASALQRGYDCLTFDGPGQGAALWRQGLHFRPDWEAVITPVLDFALDLDGVDRDRVVLLGVSQAGYWVPRAVAFEQRIAAAVADPGVWDVGTSWSGHLPPPMIELLNGGERDQFNRFLEQGMSESPAQRGTLAFRMRPYEGETPYDVYRSLDDYTLDGVADRIKCPILITDPDHEQFWPGQSRKLYEAVSTPAESKALVAFTVEEGSDSHCEPRALGLRDERIFNWLDGILGRD
jgi:hypothetical protein